jgi:hypothetical protein
MIQGTRGPIRRRSLVGNMFDQVRMADAPESNPNVLLIPSPAGPVQLRDLAPSGVDGAAPRALSFPFSGASVSPHGDLATTWLVALRWA